MAAKDRAHAPSAWIGPPEAIMERLEYIAGLGVDYYLLRFDTDRVDVVPKNNKRFAAKVTRRL